MNQDAHRLVTRTELWLQWADAHGVHYDDAGKSFDDVAPDYHQTSDAYRAFLTPKARGDVLSATHKAAANTAYARALLIEAAIEHRGGDLDLYVDPVKYATRTAGSCRRGRGPRSWGRRNSLRPPAAPPEGLLHPRDASTTDGVFRP